MKQGREVGGKGRGAEEDRDTLLCYTDAELFWIPLVGSCFGGAGLAGCWH